MFDINKKLPCLLYVDSICKSNSNISGILMSTMFDETNNKFLKDRDIQFENFIMINDMGNYISGICNLKEQK